MITEELTITEFNKHSGKIIKLLLKEEVMSVKEIYEKTNIPRNKIRGTEMNPLIVIAGTDGTGKETQTKMLVERLKEEETEIMMTDFPRYDKLSSILVRWYLNGYLGGINTLNPKTVSTFYAIDRYFASFKMKKFLRKKGEKPRAIISNRYVSANMGHQAGKISDLKKRDEMLMFLDKLEYGFFKIPRPTLNILLYAPPEIGQKNVDKKKGRNYTKEKRDLHEKDENHLKQAAESYLYCAKKFDWKIIECTENNHMRMREEIHEDIYKIVKKII